MKRKTSLVISLFLVLVLLIGVFPVSVFAADEEYVLTSIDLLSTDSSVDVTGTHVATFTVPYSYSGSVDFSDGLDIAYDTDVYTSASASFPSGSIAAVGGDPVVMTVTYLKKDDDTHYTAQYNLYAVRAAATEEDDAGTVTYEIDKNTPVKFDAEDFSDAFQDATGDDLSYVVFTLPSIDCGKLYYNYTSDTESDSVVDSDTEYYADEFPMLSKVSFVPAADYTGTVEIAYTAYNTDDSTFTGKVIITFGDAEEEDGSQHFTDVGRGQIWAGEAIDYLFEKGIINGDGKGHYNPSSSISRGDFILMLCRAFNLSADSKANFSDVEEDSYYSDAIATAKELKIAKGEGGKFNPKASLSRQDAMVLIVRAMDAAELTVQAGDPDELDVFSDSSKISDYAVEAIGTLVKAGIIEGSDGKLNPKADVSRAEMAVILYRVLTD